jgi:hypothetical protein
MRTATLVQAAADVVTVVSLKTGDVYKRLEKNTYGEQYVVKFGVVQDVMHNGEDAVITAMEFTASYSGVEPGFKVFGTDSDLKLFAAQPEEIRQHFDEITEASRRAVLKAEDELTKQRELAGRVHELIQRVSSGELTAAATSVAEVTA